MEDLTYRSKFLFSVIEKYADKNDSILEIGCGDKRNVNYLLNNGYKNVEGIDKICGMSIESIKPKKYDTIFTMSCLFLIPPENEWVFEKIAKMAKKYLIIIEGETTKEGIKVYGRNYQEVFEKYGFEQIEHQDNVFNQYGHLRVFKKL